MRALQKSIGKVARCGDAPFDARPVLDSVLLARERTDKLGVLPIDLNQAWVSSSIGKPYPATVSNTPRKAQLLSAVRAVD